MSELLALWLPIVLSTVGLFILSSLLWTVIPLHSGDFKEVPDDAALSAELEKQGIVRGQYLLPYRESAAERRSEAFKERYSRGPQALIRVWPGPANMGRNMGLTVLYFFVVSVGIAYAAAVALEPGAAAVDVFQLVCTVGVLTFAAGGVLGGVWFAKPGRVFVTDFVEALLYALLASGVFTLLWPAAEAVANTLEVGPGPT